jgi:hypothetical protein
LVGDTTTSRNERKALFHQGDSLPEVAAIRRPSQEEHSGAAHYRKTVLLR